MTSKTDIWILHIETSTKACSVALSKNDECIEYKEFLGQNFSHAEKLPVFIDDIIAESEIDKKDLSAISISSGPGSYTGLRIGCSTAKGLSFALGIPLIAIDTLQISTEDVDISPDGVYISVMKARLKEVFAAVYNADKSTVKSTFYVDLNDANTFEEYKNTPVTFVGNASHVVEDTKLCENWTYHHTDNAYKAKHMVKSAYKKFIANEFEDLAYYEPFYLKDFVVLKKKVK